ncbi:hypothetical protein GUJ93_ZPchr0019g2661 [Zizania palustris]|uniref:Nucleotide-diphospho-sugar transferase domain-containing protein n=1 Tax=Zizania palustris TaxID=103762 RepID=A0A8J5W075_ZIZPA|nr:hypothetical protein GUJ93_ZPchr0019g2661 [Zizania palustris]
MLHGMHGHTQVQLARSFPRRLSSSGLFCPPSCSSSSPPTGLACSCRAWAMELWRSVPAVIQLGLTSQPITSSSVQRLLQKKEKFPGLLPDVATGDRTVIITSANEASSRRTSAPPTASCPRDTSSLSGPRSRSSSAYSSSIGYNFLFTDVDVTWFRDPFRHIILYADLAMAFETLTFLVLRNKGKTG